MGWGKKSENNKSNNKKVIGKEGNGSLPSKMKRQANGRVERTKTNLKNARADGNPAKVQTAKDRAKMAKDLRKHIDRKGL